MADLDKAAKELEAALAKMPIEQSRRIVAEMFSSSAVQSFRKSRQNLLRRTQAE
jgi:hypothetical protein